MLTRLKGPHQVVVDTETGVEELEADAILLSTGSRPRVPDWCTPDGERILTTATATRLRRSPSTLS